MPRKRKTDRLEPKKPSLAERRAAKKDREALRLEWETKEKVRLDQQKDAELTILSRFCGLVETVALPDSLLLVGWIGPPLTPLTPIGFSIAELRKVATAIRNRALLK
jgi:hypothetical protein